jgi:hypothetical protein
MQIHYCNVCLNVDLSEPSVRALVEYITCKLVSSKSFRHTGCLKKELYNGIPYVTVLQVLRKCLHLKAYKLSTVQDVAVLK